MIPRVKLSVSEDTTRYYTTSVDFVPVIILKAMSGDIGTRQIIRSESEFISKFGKGTVDTPAAFAIQTYLRTYSFIYVTRIASNEAAYGSTKLTVDGTDLLSFKTTYKTASFNGTELKLVYDDEVKKLYLSTVLNSSAVSSVKQTIDLETATPDVLSKALDVIVTSINAMNLGFKATNLFTNKTAEDTMPVLLAENVCTISEGDSGLNNIKNADVIAAIKEYAASDVQIDVLTTPEFTDVEVITAGVKAAEDFGFIPVDEAIITSGGGEMLYGRKGQAIQRMKPFSVEVKSTLGAGDTYKAGCVYALLHGMSDEDTVRFASACSGIAISRFPLPLNPPTLKEVNALIAKGNP